MHELASRSVSLLLFVLTLVLSSGPAAGGAQDEPPPNEKALVDATIQRLLTNGFTLTLPTLDEVRRQVELPGEQALLTVGVRVSADDGVREMLERATRELGGRALDAHYEAEFGITAWETRAFRISPDPRTLRYLQTRIDALAFVLRLHLEGSRPYDCLTRSVWRLPVMPVRQLFAYGGRASIQGLGLSPVYEGKDYGFVAVRKTPVSFIFRAGIPSAAFEQLEGLEGRIIEAMGAGEESECTPVP